MVDEQDDDDPAGLADGTTFPPSLRPEPPRWTRWLPLLVVLLGLASISVPLTRRIWPEPLPLPGQEEPHDPGETAPALPPAGPPALRLEFPAGAALGPGPLPLLVIGAETLEVRIDGDPLLQDLPSDLTPGEHVLEVVARSANGEASERRSFVFEPSLAPPPRDDDAPQVELVHPARPWRTMLRHVSFRVRDLGGLRSVTLLLDGGSRVPQHGAEEEGWLRFRLEGLPLGPHALILSAVDRAGNERRLERRFDVVPP